jgi:hypothetical protein
MGVGGRLDAAADAQLGEDPRQAHARGLLAHEQRGADLAVRGALGDERQHPALARREPEAIDRVVGRRGGSSTSSPD